MQRKYNAFAGMLNNSKPNNRGPLGTCLGELFIIMILRLSLTLPDKWMYWKSNKFNVGQL